MVLGQIPPPYGGQTIMIENLLRGVYDGTRLLHINTAFSKSLSEMAHSSPRKALRLGGVLTRALWLKVRQQPSVLYYHPAGANTSAILRDLVLLTALRPLFRMTIFHMHARGLPDGCAGLPGLLRRLAIHAYAAPDVLLAPSAAVIQENTAMLPRHARVIPNGAEGGSPRDDYSGAEPIRILFLNLISDAKGAGWLIDALGELRSQHVNAELTLIGEFSSADYREALLKKVRRLGLEERVSTPGTAVGQAKWDAMTRADIFCVPSTWAQESFGLVLIEAASCGLPVVAADVPGVRDVLEPGSSVVLVSPGDRSSLARELRKLCEEEATRKRLGVAARRAYEERYTLDRFWQEVGQVFSLVSEELRAAS